MFLAETIAGLTLRMVELLKCSWREAIWEIPLTFCGHLCAADSKSKDKLSVDRPKDLADKNEQERRRVERERKGELHPWQVLDNAYHISPLQFANNPYIEIERKMWLQYRDRIGREALRQELIGKGLMHKALDAEE